MATGAFAQTGSSNLLAYEPFDGPVGALYGATSGQGWDRPWDVQNGDTSIPGFNVASGNPLAANGLQLPQTGNYAVGGAAYLMAGRHFDTSATGPFADYLSNNLIGQPGQTLWLSALMRKDANTQDDFFVTLHNNASPSWWERTPGVEAGYFGWASFVNGARYWALRIDGQVYNTNAVLTLGEAALLVVRIDFGATSTVSLYVNPPLGGAAPASPDAQATTGNSPAFQSLAYSSGSGPNQTALDEIRIAADFSSATTASSAPPTAPATLTATPGNGQVSLSWNPSGGATSYQLWASDGGAFQVVATQPQTTFQHTGLLNGTTYSYYVVAANAAGSSQPSTQVNAVPRAPLLPPVAGLGTNLSAVVDWTREWPFVDAFKVARTWISQQTGAQWGQGPPLQLTPEGWIASLQPGQYAETVMYDNQQDTPADFPTGNYTLLYDGEGTLAFDLGTASIISQTPGRMVVNVPPGPNGIFLEITATNPDNPVRNIRFIMPGFEDTYQTQPFHPKFLAKLAGYKTLRFMEWMLANNSTVQHWSDRATTSDYTYTWRGVPLEVMIQLANTLNASPWFNMPHAADDNFVTQFAGMVQQQLSPALKSYVEYSNETWNGMFTQTAYVQNQGMTQGLSSDPTAAGAFYTAKRSVQIFQLWQQVFGGTSRFVRVLPSQFTSPALSQEIVTYQNAYGYADALAVAPYYSICSDQATGGWGFLGDPSTASQVAAMTVDQVLDIELSHIRNCALNNITAQAQIANQYGLHLLAYEGGQHLVATGGAQGNQQLVSLFEQVNRSPRIQDLYSEYLQDWKNAGGDMFVHYSDVTSYTQYGSFGALEYQDQDPATAPKYQALMNFAGQNP